MNEWKSPCVLQDIVPFEAATLLTITYIHKHIKQGNGYRWQRIALGRPIDSCITDGHSLLQSCELPDISDSSPNPFLMGNNSHTPHYHSQANFGISVVFSKLRTLNSITIFQKLHHILRHWWGNRWGKDCQYSPQMFNKIWQKKQIQISLTRANVWNDGSKLCLLVNYAF